MQNVADWNDYHYFLKVAESGSLKKAAKVLGVNNSTVFRRINSLEGKLGARLFERLKTGYLLTEAGEEVLRLIRQVDETMVSVQRIAQGKDTNLRGTLKISTTDTIGFYWLPPLLSRFQEEYPEVVIDLVINNRFTDLSQREADIVIPAINKQPDYMVGRKLAPIIFKLCASRGYLERFGAPSSINDISNHRFILPGEGIAAIPPYAWLKNHIALDQAVISCDKLTGLHQLARENLGITLLPLHVICTDPELVVLFDIPERMELHIWMLTHPDLRQVARIKAFMHFMTEATRTYRD